jgi:iron complex outermembrane receptor protein
VYDKADYHDFRYTCNSIQTPGVGACDADGTQDISGQPAIGSPRWKKTSNLSYTNKLFGGLPVNYTGRVGYVWESSVQYNIGDDPLSREPSYGLLNASLDFTRENGRWTVQLYGKNLTDRLYFSSLYSAPVLSASFGYLARDFHRYGGISFKYSY